LNNENSELDSVIDEVRRELRNVLLKWHKLIAKLGFAFEKVVANKESICEEIKNCLKEEIAQEIISPRTIEQSCRSEWKKKTRPRQENEKISFSRGKSKVVEQEQRKILLDNLGNPVQYKAEDNYSDPNPDVDPRQDVRVAADHGDDLIHRLNGIIRELIYENKKIRQEKEEIQLKLGEAIESLQLQKHRESEQHQNVFDTEFPVDYRQLQKYMAQIYKSTVRQEVWLTVKIDTNKKKVVSVQIGKKLIPQNVVV
jgi:hypothetical protein